MRVSCDLLEVVWRPFYGVFPCLMIFLAVFLMVFQAFFAVFSRVFQAFRLCLVVLLAICLQVLFEGFSSALSQILTGSSSEFSRMVPSDALGLLVEASGFQSFPRRDFFWKPQTPTNPSRVLLAEPSQNACNTLKILIISSIVSIIRILSMISIVIVSSFRRSVAMKKSRQSKMGSSLN